MEKNSSVALPGKEGHSTFNTVCPDLEGIVRSFIVMVQGGCDQLVDILLIGWRGGNKQESASSTIRFQLVSGLHACGQHTVNFSHLVGVSVSAKQLKDIVTRTP